VRRTDLLPSCAIIFTPMIDGPFVMGARDGEMTEAFEKGSERTCGAVAEGLSEPMLCIVWQRCPVGRL